MAGRVTGIIRLTLPEPPSINNYYGYRGKLRYFRPRGKLFRQQVALECAGLTPLTGDVCVRVRWIRSRRVGDVDNILKPLLDALKGRAFGDDARVARIEIERDDSDRAHARCDVEILTWPMG